MERWLAETFDQSLKLASEAMHDLENVEGRPIEHYEIEKRYKRYVREILIWYDGNKDKLRDALGLIR
jgi:hypothetical protein